MKKADNLHRVLAKAIDIVILATLSRIPGVGVLAGAIYIVTSDGFFNGRSVGKKLIGLRVVVTSASGEPRPCDFRASLVRNLIYAVVAILSSIPYVGWFLFFPLGLIVIGIEGYFVYADEKGIRIGDIFADTQVLDASAPAG